MYSSCNVKCQVLLQQRDACSKLAIKYKIKSVNVMLNFGKVNPFRPNPRRRGKTNLNFIFTLLCGASKGFMKGKAFIKPFEAPQRSIKVKI